MTKEFNLSIPEKMKHSFCAAKWHWVTLHFGMQSNHSCYHPEPKHWELSDIENNPSGLHNTKWKKEQRKKMLNGERPEECHYCWNFEDLDDTLISDRKNFSSAGGMFSNEIPEIVKMTGDENINPKYIEVSFNHSCNLACSYCSPGQSSRWHEEIRKHGPYPVEDPTVRHIHDMVDEDENPYIEAFWKWLPECYSDLKVLRLTGGEPLMSSSADKLLDYVIQMPINEELDFAYNTNLCTPDRRITHLIKKAKQINEKVREFRIYTSAEAFGEQAEYIRYGFEWDKWCKNTRRVLEEGIVVSVMCTFGILSIVNFNKFVEQIFLWREEGLPVRFSVSTLINPNHFDVRLLPDIYDKYIEEIQDFYNKNHDRFLAPEKRTMENLFKFCKNKDYKNDSEKAALLRDFSRFFREYDKRRNLNFLDIFPELSDLYKDSNSIDVKQLT
jgi:organic radical activating enzyme